MSKPDETDRFIKWANEVRENKDHHDLMSPVARDGGSCAWVLDKTRSCVTNYRVEKNHRALRIQIEHRASTGTLPPNVAQPYDVLQTKHRPDHVMDYMGYKLDKTDAYDAEVVAQIIDKAQRIVESCEGNDHTPNLLQATQQLLEGFQTLQTVCGSWTLLNDSFACLTGCELQNYLKALQKADRKAKADKWSAFVDTIKSHAAVRFSGDMTVFANRVDEMIETLEEWGETPNTKDAKKLCVFLQLAHSAVIEDRVDAQLRKACMEVKLKQKENSNCLTQVRSGLVHRLARELIQSMRNAAARGDKASLDATYVKLLAKAAAVCIVTCKNIEADCQTKLANVAMAGDAMAGL